MCGIAGAVGRPVSDGAIKRTCQALAHRGPDGQGVRVLDVGAQKVTLIHTRLAIIDLDGRANQPFEKSGLVLIFNGELYNYKEIRTDLEALGERFTTDSDTEVLLSAYKHWHEAAFDRFEGMWALALVDCVNQKVLLSRDRFGEKPLFVYRDQNTLYFASEVKALRTLSGQNFTLNQDRLARYMVQGYKTLYRFSGETYYQEVEEFPAGCFGYVTNADCQAQRYWQLRYAERSDMNQAEAVEEVQNLLERSLALRLRSDVPLAFCLSGGIDSGLLAGIAAKKFGYDIATFSVVDSDPRYDEQDMLDQTVRYLGCRNHKVFTSKEGFFGRMEKLIAAHDAPIATISYYMHSFLSQAIAEQGYKVAISGTAADEIFSGYFDHYGMWLAHMHDHDPHNFDRHVQDWREGYGAIVRNPDLQDPLAFVHNPAQRSHITLNESVFKQFMQPGSWSGWQEENFGAPLLRNRMMNELLHEVTPVILKEDDSNSMAFSLENRSPFLDRQLVDFMMTVPTQHLMGNGMAKLLLRQAGEGVMADAVRLDKRKRGFNASIESLVDFKDAETQEYLLAESPIFDLVDRGQIENFLTQGDVHSNSFSKFAFSFISSKMFVDHHHKLAHGGDELC